MMLAAQISIVIGVAISGISIFYTFSFAWDPKFEAPALPYGRRHTNYHAFREGTLQLAVASILLFGLFCPDGSRSLALWVAMFVAALGLVVGWWLAYPILGLKAPNRGAVLVHLAATILLVLGLALAFPTYRQTM